MAPKLRAWRLEPFPRNQIENVIVKPNGAKLTPAL
jgi:hypothetical protein